MPANHMATFLALSVLSQRPLTFPEVRAVNGYAKNHIAEALDGQEDMPEDWKNRRLIAARLDWAIYHLLGAIHGETPDRVQMDKAGGMRDVKIWTEAPAEVLMERQIASEVVREVPQALEKWKDGICRIYPLSDGPLPTEDYVSAVVGPCPAVLGVPTSYYGTVALNFGEFGHYSPSDVRRIIAALQRALVIIETAKD